MGCQFWQMPLARPCEQKERGKEGCVCVILSLQLPGVWQRGPLPNCPSPHGQGARCNTYVVFIHPHLRPRVGGRLGLGTAGGDGLGGSLCGRSGLAGACAGAGVAGSGRSAVGSQNVKGADEMWAHRAMSHEALAAAAHCCLPVRTAMHMHQPPHPSTQ